MINRGCNRETVYFAKALSQHFDPVVPISTQDTSSDDSVKITNVLQATEGDNEVQTTHARIDSSSFIDSRKTDKEDDSGIKCKLTLVLRRTNKKIW